MKLNVLNSKGEKTGRSVEFSDEIAGMEPNDHVLYLDVKRYLINQRQGTHKAKERNEIAGSSKKLIKQKGSGGARRGNVKSPLLRGGGRVHGPRPRTYDIKLNKKEIQLARQSAFAYKAKDNAILVMEALSFDAPKTKQFIEVLGALQAADKKTLLLINEKNENVIRSARNIPNADVMVASEVNTYALLHADTVIMDEAAVNTINEILK
jgi:large subunit ribosomal protein L4